VGANLLGGRQIACRPVRDEPAHDLDIETPERFESLLVSRDRACRNDLAASTLVIDDDGLVNEQEAGHDGDLRQRTARSACQSRPDPDVPCA